jgi:hypothetical protein
MSILKWIKENVFDWSYQPPVYRGHRPPEHPPGWENIQRAKKRANKRLHSRLAGTMSKNRKGRKPASG